MKNKYIYLIFVLILLIGIFLRLYLVSQVPASPDWDEVALGYNAYSILLTGKDEYGKSFPIILQSFNDYKPALYAYLIIPFLKIFNLSVFAVRLPSILFGITSLIIVFFISREIFSEGFRFNKLKINRDILSLTIMFFLAISPWHIQFSRVAFEAQVGLSFNLIAILLFLKSLKKNFLLPLAMLFASLSIYVYQSEKVYIPLLFIILLITFFKDVKKISKKWLIISLIFGFLIILPMLIYILTNPNSLTRAKGVSVFSDSTKLLSKNTEKLSQDRQNSDYFGLILDNRRIEYVKAFTNGYLSHFEPNWLFYRGDELRHQPPFMGLVYIFEIPLILIGIYALIFSTLNKRYKYFIFMYILIAPIPASVTYDVPHAVRSINMLPIIQIFSSIGFLVILYFFSKRSKFVKSFAFLIFFSVVIFNFVYYINQYFVQMNYYYSKAWQYGWDEAVSYALKHSEDFDKVIVSNVSPLDQSYIFFLFYTKYNPQKYISYGGTSSGSFNSEHKGFGKFEFRPINWGEDKFLKNTLFIGRPGDLPDNIGKIIYYKNGEPAIVFSEKHE